MSGIFDQIINYSPPLIVSGTVNYDGTWDASTNTPTLNNPPAGSTKGDYYVVSVAGTQFSLTFAVGDWIISNGTAWEKVDLTDAVSSVFGRTGAVVGVSTDYSSVGLTNTAIGASSPSTGAFTTVTASSTIAATGAVTGSNLSGTNTGDQTITLTGGVTGSGTGSFAATVVTNANLTGAITSVGNATSLGSFSSANLASALTDETGSGAAVFATSPTLVTPILGTPSSGTLTSCTGLPISTGVSGLGTGIATALAVNVGTAGAPVVNGGALGVPTSGTVTNLTGTASININGTVGATTASTVAATTISTTGTVTATANNIKAFVGTTGAGTGFAYGTYETNGGAQYGRVGIEGSVAGQLFTGTAAYDFVVGGISGNTWIGAGGTGIAKVSATGLAVTGTLSATGNVDIGSSGGSRSISIYGSDTSNAITGTLGIRIVNGNAGATGRLTPIAFGGRGLANSPFAAIAGCLTADTAFEQAGTLRFYAKGTATSGDPSLVMEMASTGLAVTGTLENTVANSGWINTNSGASNKQWRVGGGSSGQFGITEVGVADRLIISAGGATALTGNLAVTGTLSSTTASTLCSTNGVLTVGSNTATGGGIIVNTLSTTGNMPYINFKAAGTQCAIFGLTGAALGTTATDALIFAETGKSINLWPNGGTTGVIINSTGLAVTGALSSTTGANFATSSGSVGIGTASPGKTLDVNGTVQFRDAAGAGQAFWVANKGVGSANSGAFGLGYDAVNYTPGSASSAIYWDGGTGYFTLSTSARRYKRNIVAVTDEQLDKALLLKPSYYQRNEYDYYEYGFIAEEVNEIGLDEFVTRVEGEISGLAYDKMVTLAIALAQRQAKENANLVAELQSLRARLAALESN